MSGTESACGDISKTSASLFVKSALGVLEPDSYCAIRMSAVFSGNPTTCPKYFCVIPQRLRKNLILSPIAIKYTPYLCNVQSVYHICLVYVKQHKTKKFNIFVKTT